MQRVLSLAEKILFLANFIVMYRAYSNVLNILAFSLLLHPRKAQFDSGLIPLNP